MLTTMVMFLFLSVFKAQQVGLKALGSTGATTPQ
jgi:hypothetical protein